MRPLMMASSSSAASRRICLAAGQPLGTAERRMTTTIASGSASGSSAPPARRRGDDANAGTSSADKDARPSPSAAPATALASDRNKRSKYTDNWQRRRAHELAPQVVLRTPMPEQGARVAIIGGGVAGLVCARELARLGVRSVVFDTGERGAGGRVATRTTADGSFAAAAAGSGSAGAAAPPPPLLSFDHAAQLFTADDPEFQALARGWLDNGWVREWAADKVVRVGGGKATAAAAADQSSPLPVTPYFVPSGAAGFRGLARALAEDARATGLVELRFGAWVSRLTADACTGKWKAASRKASGGGNGGGGGGSGGGNCSDPSGAVQAGDDASFDAVVLAHNGKCLNRLSAPMGCPLVAAQVMRLRLSAAWVAMLAFQRTVGAPFEGAFVGGGAGGSGGEGLAWAANNSAKLGLDGPAECWTLVSTDAFAQRRKVPQERVPADVAAAVAAELTAAFEQAILRAKGAGAGADANAGGGGTGEQGGAAASSSLPPLAAPPRVQLWGAALPLNSPRVPCLLDPASRVGVCGDWLLGAGVQSAALSGLGLARRLAALRGVETEKCEAALLDEGGQGSLAAGLRAPFAPLGPRTGACGEFPPSSAAAAAAPAAVAPVVVARAAPPLIAKAARR